MALEILCEVHTQTQSKPNTRRSEPTFCRCKDDEMMVHICMLCTYALMENTICLISINRW